MTEQEIAAALLRHEPCHIHHYGVRPDSFEWFRGSSCLPVSGLRYVVSHEVYDLLSCKARADCDWIAFYPSPEAAYADLANAYRLAYPAPIS